MYWETFNNYYFDENEVRKLSTIQKKEICKHQNSLKQFCKTLNINVRKGTDTCVYAEDIEQADQLSYLNAHVYSFIVKRALTHASLSFNLWSLSTHTHFRSVPHHLLIITNRKCVRIFREVTRVYHRITTMRNLWKLMSPYEHLCDRGCRKIAQQYFVAENVLSIEWIMWHDLINAHTTWHRVKLNNEKLCCHFLYIFMCASLTCSHWGESSQYLNMSRTHCHTIEPISLFCQKKNVLKFR